NGIYLIRNGELQEIKPDKQPVGRHHQRRPYTNHSMQLQQGDCLYLFSDGIADQFGGPKGKKFKYAQLKRVLLENHTYAMPVQLHKLEEAFENWKGNLEQIDDVCVMGIRVE